jgi:hypothetical protein
MDHRRLRCTNNNIAACLARVGRAATITRRHGSAYAANSSTAAAIASAAIAFGVAAFSFGVATIAFGVAAFSFGVAAIAFGVAAVVAAAAAAITAAIAGGGDFNHSDSCGSGWRRLVGAAAERGAVEVCGGRCNRGVFIGCGGGLRSAACRRASVYRRRRRWRAARWRAARIGKYVPGPGRRRQRCWSAQRCLR